MKYAFILAAATLFTIESANAKPTWNTRPITLPDGSVGTSYVQNLGSFIDNPGGDPVVCSLACSGWLSMTSGCLVAGTPTASDVGSNSCDVTVSDGKSSETNVVYINVKP